MTTTFADRLAFGRTAEDLVAEILMRRFGCHVIPVYDYNTRPRSCTAKPPASSCPISTSRRRASAFSPIPL